MEILNRISNDTGVAIVFFNRPDALKKVIESIREAKPPKLFLIQDGPRDEKDLKEILDCRKLIDTIDWDCEIQKNYSEINLGCGKRISSGISWVFEYVEKTIILEDDCVPIQTFYSFCQEMLDRYENDERIIMITGMNHWGKTETEEDYFFAINGAIWGWATWKRSWKMFDYTVAAIDDNNIREFLLNGIEPKRIAEIDIERWKQTRKKVMANEKISYWAHQWRLVKLINHNLCIIPRTNLISNVGDENGTHPTGGNAKCEFHNMSTMKMEFPLKHPLHIYQNYNYDKKYYKEFFPTTFNKIIKKITRLFK